MNIQSIQARLKNYSKEHKKIHQYTVTRFFQERFLYRLSISDYRDNFLLKGGALIYIYGAEESRYTKDIDFLIRRRESEYDDLIKIFKEIGDIKYNDGVIFDTENISADIITKEGLYTGTRIKFRGVLGNIKQYLQIDIGTGDYVTPGPQNVTYPTILAEFEKPKLKAYSIETLIAEKFEAMISLGEYNTRMKDFYDLYKFVGESNSNVLANAIKNTFGRRSTKLSESHPVFTEEFYTELKRVDQWEMFLSKNEIETINFKEVYFEINKWLKPVYIELLSKLK